METIVQTKFSGEEYDIDDGLVIPRSSLVDSRGDFLTPGKVREAVKDALSDGRFRRQPELCSNCVRVFYADEDREKHHLDFPIYRTFDESGRQVKELANESGWVESDPTQVNVWFEELIKQRNLASDGRGTQLRQLVQLLKRFCRSQLEWLDAMPNGMKLTMLVAECQPAYENRIDVIFRVLVENIARRLSSNKVILNLAHPQSVPLTRASADANVVFLKDRLDWAATELRKLDSADFNKLAMARAVWDSLFRSDGFFKEYDESLSPARSLVSSLVEMIRLPWVEAPRWTMNLTHSAFLSGSWSEHEDGSHWHSFSSDGPALRKHLHLRFQGDTNATGSFKVYWQVVNSGSEAAMAGGLRGEMIASQTDGVGGLVSTTAPGPLRKEKTLYSGKHWVECFIVKNGICIARSGPFIVNIE